MSHWFEGLVLANDVQLHYYRTGGTAKPPLLLLHGFTDAGLCWTSVARDLEADYDIVMLDARGHGCSGAAVSGFTTEMLVADVVAVIQALQLPPVTLLGHSMGGHMAAHVTKKHPELVRAVMLEDPPWRGLEAEPLSGEEENGLEQWATNMRELQKQPLAERLEDAADFNPHWLPDDVRTWAEAQGQFQVEVFTQGLYQVSRDWKAIVPELARPGLLITGDPIRGAIVTPEVAQQALATWPEGRLAYIEGTGHSIRRDQHEAFVTAVRQFLKEN
ncbi:alpha/beta fold hydrolase [Dictyobacter formicarum]|uniref:AB hydrolase-1 domain-containing protein n=1 Tax=Dictyobacter formicarum TaxID=2778368 RepID=A0ABQ3VSE1_9CHLR|nr:alpha/beta hydrolase [Dictyobacter formicarum]GHO88738.1 hypothetical protein KSZ_67440 [Dictyobacter formicarum]